MISEWVILQILSASHKQKMLIEWQNQRLWGHMSKLGPRKDSVGMRFAVLGYGSIGRQGKPSPHNASRRGPEQSL